jgi:hypothetical protein
MYQPPTIFDFQRNLDTLIHTGEHQARAAAAHVKSDHTGRGLADATTIITMSIGRFDEIHKDILQRAMQLIEDFCSRNSLLSPGGLAGAARDRLDGFGTFLLATVPPTSFTQDAHRFRGQYTVVFRQRLDGALRDIEIGFIGGRKITTVPAAPPPASDATPPTKLTDALTLRPTFMGMSVDVPKAWNWVRDKRRGLKRPQ